MPATERPGDMPYVGSSLMALSTEDSEGNGEPNANVGEVADGGADGWNPRVGITTWLRERSDDDEAAEDRLSWRWAAGGGIGGLAYTVGGGGGG